MGKHQSEIRGLNFFLLHHENKFLLSMSFDNVKKSPKCNKSNTQPSLNLTQIVCVCALIKYFTPCSNRAQSTTAIWSLWEDAIYRSIFNLIVSDDIGDESKQRVNKEHKKHDEDMVIIVVKEQRYSDS